jgi:hypothetical protein
MQVKYRGYDKPERNTVCCFLAGMDTYIWKSREDWRSFCEQARATFTPEFVEQPDTGVP